MVFNDVHQGFTGGVCGLNIASLSFESLQKNPEIV
jgi:hypothetical protein